MTPEAELQSRFVTFLERRRDLVSKRTQIVDCKHTLLTVAQMIGKHLQRLTREVLIDVISGLVGCEMRA